jgi:dephospho-CoA kinase
MVRVGLTGGIGSGKSTVARMLVGHGATLIDADAISRSVTASGGSAIAPLRQAFGPDFITPEGALDRDRMRQASYADPQARKQLEAIVHPLVGAESARQESAAVALCARCIVFDVPLLVESRRWRQRVDLVFVVDCLAEVQIARVMQRSGLDAVTIERIIATQAPRSERLRAADIVVSNSGDSQAPLAREVAQAAALFGL